MPSPFPGMDPYLEGALWTSVHTQLSVEIVRQLAPRLRPRYVVRTPRRFVLAGGEAEEEVTVSTASLYPDVGVAEVAAAQAEARHQSGAVAVVPLQVHTVMPELVSLVLNRPTLSCSAAGIEGR